MAASTSQVTDPSGESTAAGSESVNRYPGVLPFGDTQLDRLRFFGRESEAVTLLHQVLAAELLVLFAKPGLGKTSLLNTRIFPMLRKREYLPLPVRFNNPDGAHNPIELFESEIERVCTFEGIEYTCGEMDSLWVFFKTAMFWRHDRLLTPVLILDQFEELFNLQKEHFRHTVAAEIGQLFGGRLPDHVRTQLEQGQSLPFSEQPPEVKVLISLREDDLGLLQELAPEIPTILQNRFRLVALTKVDARQAIIAPAQVEYDDIQFSTRPFVYDEAVIEKLISTANDEHGVDPFLLQILCSHVESKVKQKQQAGIRNVTVNSRYLGGDQGIDQLTANIYLDAIKMIPGWMARRGARRAVEKQLITDTGRRRSVLREDLRKSGMREAALETLRRARLVRKEPKHGSFYYEISHDRLAKAIHHQARRWPWERMIAATCLLAFVLSIGFYYLDKRVADSNRLAQQANEIAVEQLRRESEALWIDLFEEAEIARTEGRLTDALVRFKEATQIIEGLCVDDPSNAFWQADLAITYSRTGEVQRSQGNLEHALNSFQTSLEILEPLVAQDPSNPRWQDLRSLGYTNIGGVQLAQGELDASLKSYRTSLDIDSRRVEQSPADPSVRGNLAFAYLNVGNVQLAQGDAQAAFDSFNAGLSHDQLNADVDPKNDGYQANLSYSQTRVGDAYFALGQLSEASKYFDQGLKIRRALVKKEPKSNWLNYLSSSHKRIGTVHAAQGALKRALSSFQEALKIDQQLTDIESSNSGWQDDLSECHLKIGQIRIAMGNLASAMHSFEDSLGIMKVLAESDETNKGRQRDLSIRQRQIGYVRFMQGDFDDAELSSEESMRIIQGLVDINPSNNQWKSELAKQHSLVGDFRLAEGKLDDTSKSYQDCLTIVMPLAESGHKDWQNDLSQCYRRIGDMQQARKEFDNALESYQKSLEIAVSLGTHDSTNANWTQDLAICCRNLGDAQLAKQEFDLALYWYERSLTLLTALTQMERIHAIWRMDLSKVHMGIGDVMVEKKDIDGALASYEKVRQIREELIALDATNVKWKTEFAESLIKLGKAQQRQDPDAIANAKENYERALNILRPLGAEERLTAKPLEWIPELESKLTEIADAAK